MVVKVMAEVAASANLKPHSQLVMSLGFCSGTSSDLLLPGAQNPAYFSYISVILSIYPSLLVTLSFFPQIMKYSNSPE